MTLGETPWVDRNLNEAWSRLVHAVPVSYLPSRTIAPRSRGRFVFTELGCGHYGCVMPTNEPGLVFKITSDVTEARFVSMALTLDWPEGIVKYKQLFELPGLTHRRRPLFVLWRETAKDVGILDTSVNMIERPKFIRERGPDLEKFGFEPWQERPIIEGVRLLVDFRNTAALVRPVYSDLIRRTSSRPEEIMEQIWALFDDPSRVHYEAAQHPNRRSLVLLATRFRECYSLAQSIANTDVVYHVGEALMHYMDEGILLADVHLNNIGRNMQDEIVITDPGHAIVFKPTWFPPPRIPLL